MKFFNRFILLYIFATYMVSCCSDDILNFYVSDIEISNFDVEIQENTNNVSQQDFALRVILVYDGEKGDNGLWCSSNGNYISGNKVTTLNFTANSIVNGIPIGESINELFKLKMNNKIFEDFTAFITQANNLEFIVYEFIFDDTITIQPTTTAFTIELTLADNSILSATTNLVTIN
jgi:hypothetical protein